MTIDFRSTVSCLRIFSSIVRSSRARRVARRGDLGVKSVIHVFQRGDSRKLAVQALSIVNIATHDMDRSAF